MPSLQFDSLQSDPEVDGMGSSHRSYLLDIGGGNTITVFDGEVKDRPGLRSIMAFRDDSEFTVPYHFHPTQTETMRVTKGHIDIRAAGRTIRRKPGMDDLVLPPGIRHGFTVPKGLEAVLETYSDNPESKPIFFRSFFAHGNPKPLHALTSFYRDGDTYPAFNDYAPKILGKMVVWIIGGFFGHFLNLSPPPPLDESHLE